MAAKAGGSALNSTISLGRIGIDTYFLSEVGNDPVGDIIKDFLNKNGINSKYINTFKTGKSAVSLAFLDENNDANYHFYKDYPNQRLKGEFPDFNKDDILLFGSFYGLNSNLRPKVKEILIKAKESGSLIIYDPNFRSSHLPELEELKERIIENISFADITRGSDEDFKNIFNLEKTDLAYEQVKNICKNFIVTKNKNGVDIFTRNFKESFTVKEIVPVSTIGAGDNFNAGIIFGLIKNHINKKNINSTSKEVWKDIIENAIKCSENVCLSLDNYIDTDLAKKLKKIL
jgi:fructokinase